MSLHNAAQHLKAQGRGPDDQLVHMSGKEVAGLQALAMSHGGSLTVNPETGLPEAGFLDNLLPTIIGAGAMFLSGGTITPLMAGLGVGGIEAARTGDLSKGLMAGLGAFGGAGALGSLAETGASMVGSEMAMADKLGAGTEALAAAPEANMLGGWKNIGMAAAPAVLGMLAPEVPKAPDVREQMIRPYSFAANAQTPQNMIGAQYQPGQDTSERSWFQPQYTALTPYKAAAGGLMDLTSIAGGGPVEAMSNANAVGQNTGYPQADISGHSYSTPWQTPVSENVVQGAADTGVNRMTGEMSFAGGGLSSLAKSMVGEDVMPMEQDQEQRMAAGGVSNLGGYSDGGRMLKGPGDGMSDSIPAQIGGKQPARLADGEFVVPADVVSHLGNGSTDAGAKQLYKMMDRIRTQRTGKKKQAPEVNPSKAMPA